ncbi:hypothetical protein HHK36_003907 [Tetracentron sinense]|uniref:DRBM domain-containing protein n=1 Tax=Tetracentron sinense TaxID=13715 RepID=A0A835DP08_TETSI|nr:hypothetical protein HHK36_003907 [Tetracentron sinense]
MPFSFTVEIGGIQYIGAAARTKKEAEIKVAWTALLAIQSNAGGPEGEPSDSSQLTVVPCKKKGTESGEDGWGLQRVGSEQNYASGIQVVDSGVLAMEANSNFQDTLKKKSIFNRNEEEISTVEGAADIKVGNSGILVADTNGTSQDGQPMALNFNQNEKDILAWKFCVEFK